MSKGTNSANGKMSKLVVIMYVAAGVLGAAFIYMFIYAVNYVSSYISSYGLSFGDMWTDAIQYVVAGSISYLVFGLLLFAAGKILDTVQRKGGVSCASAESKPVEAPKKIKEVKEEETKAEEPAAVEVKGIKVPPLFR